MEKLEIIAVWAIAGFIAGFSLCARADLSPSKYALSDACGALYADYDRKCYTHWSDADNDGQDTRQEVLERDSMISVVKNRKGRIISGLWCGKFTGYCSQDPGDFDIDHGLALGDADSMGAGALSPEDKASLANDMGHLFVTSKWSNRFKGAKNLLQYWPSNISFLREYAEMRLYAIQKYGLVAQECEAKLIVYAQKFGKYFEKGVDLVKVRDFVVDHKEIFKHKCFLY